MSGGKGKLIVLEGINGSSKKTQAELLKERLEREGYQVVTHSFPTYGSPQAYGIECYLSSELGDISSVDPKFAAWLYAVDRACIARSKLIPALEAGKIVLLDRYVASNTAHQGGKIQDEDERMVFIKWLDRLEFNQFKIPKPDLTIFLRTVPSLTLQILEEEGEVKNKTKLLEDMRASLAVYEEIQEFFDNWHIINRYKPLDEEDLNNPTISVQDKLPEKEELHEQIYEQVKKMLNN